MKILQHIKLREGFVDEVYLDSLGKPTAGVGHLLTDTEQTKYKLGEKVPRNILDMWLRQDSQTAILAASQQSEMLPIMTWDLFVALVSVNFQLGTNWYNIHKKTWTYMVAGEYEAAAQEAEDSKWFRQTPVRVRDLQRALRGAEA